MGHVREPYPRRPTPKFPNALLSLLHNYSQLFFAHTILRELRALLSVPAALNPCFVFSRTHLLRSIRPNHHAPTHQRARRHNATRRNHQPRQPLAQGIPHRPPRRPAIRIRSRRCRGPPPSRRSPPLRLTNSRRSLQRIRRTPPRAPQPISQPSRNRHPHPADHPPP